MKRLRSGQPDQIKSALDDVRTSGKAGAPAAPAIAELLQLGALPDADAGGDRHAGDTEAGRSEVLSVYAHHRNVELRRAAIRLSHGPAAPPPCAQAALSDPDPAVRGLAATGLGNMKARDTVS